MKMKEFRHLELFAGLGGFRKAIDLFCKDNGLKSNCVGYSEIDKFASKTYKSNFDTRGEIEIGDIIDFTSNESNIKSLPNFDFLSGGFPCQAFSMMGKKKGFQDVRGNVFYTIIHILRIKKPKYILLENVRNIKNHDNGNTFKEILRSLEDDAGYNVFTDVFNTADFGLPQNRRRVFFFGVRKDLNKNLNKINFSSENIKQQKVQKTDKTRLKLYENVLDDLLEKNVEEKYYLSERIKPTILSDGSKNYRSKSEINQLIARPLTATMVKMHRANQDNYYSDEFLENSNSKIISNHIYTKEEQAKLRIRKLTPLEALKLQGFDEEFYYNASNEGISNHQLYKQAGNAVSVNTVYNIIRYLFRNNIIQLETTKV